MALCDNCRAELERAADRLPEPWFDHDLHRIGGVRVSPKEWEILLILWRRRSQVVSADSLMTLLYGARSKDPPLDKIIDVFICKLRAKLAAVPYWIRTVHGVGFQFVEGQPPPAEAEVGPAETGVARAPSARQQHRNRDKYGLAQMQPGQSRLVENTTIEALRGACQMGRKRGFGEFRAGHDRAGGLRIWRDA